MKDSKISWTNHTFNGLRGCAKVSAGCDHCYAESMSHSNPKTLGVWGEEGTRVLASESMWAQPLLWNREAEKAGVRARVFSYSLGDVFERPTKPENLAVCEAARARLFALIERTPWLDWLLLTKRAENIMGMIPEPWRAGLPSNVWAGTSVENQAMADERIPHLLKVPARVRFLSMEPLLSAVNIDPATCQYCRRGEYALKADGLFGVADDGATPWCIECDSEMGFSAWLDPCADEKQRGINWVIVGGESGPGARPFDIAWARSIRDQCKSAGVACFVKQLGAKPIGAKLQDAKGGDPTEWPEDLRVREIPNGNA